MFDVVRVGKDMCHDRHGRIACDLSIVHRNFTMVVPNFRGRNKRSKQKSDSKIETNFMNLHLNIEAPL